MIRMADPELALKLARRLESVDEAPTDGPKVVVPPPVPKMPEKVVPNPYVAADDSVSIDDLIAKAMERKEHREENNNVATSDSITMDEGHVAMATANGSDSQPNHSGVPPKRSLADLLAKDQERPASPPHASPAGTAAKQAPPPKTTIGELLVKDKRPLSPPPTNKCPIIPVQHHVPKPEVRRKSPEDDGSELERKLAAQRAKKSQTMVPAPETNVIFSSSQNSSPSPHTLPQVGEPETKPVPKSDEAETSSLPAETEKAPPAEVPKKPARAVDLEKHSPGQESEKPPTGPIEVHVPEATLEEVKAEAGSEAERQKSELSSAESDEPRKPVVQETEATSAQAEPVEKSPPPPPLPSTEPPALKDSSVRETDVPPQLEQIKMPPPPPPPSLEPPALGPLNETDLKNLLVDEVKRCKITKEEMIVIKDMELRKEESARPFSPTKELIEMIQHENGIRSPPPIPPPKPQTPSHSRPQSPVVKKFSMPSVAATTELKMFAERHNKLSPHIQKSFSQDNGDELSALLERRTKILQGESVPEMINKKLSLYAEFSEFSRKQIKFFTETFRKYDEDADGFIDFDELKRMMEKLGEAQTHIALKEIIRQVDEDKDGKISLREFFLIFRLAAQNQLGCSQVFQLLADSVDVSKEGVLGAASFFQAKIEEQTKVSRFEQEMKEEQEERKRLEEEKKARREKFLQNKSIFQ